MARVSPGDLNRRVSYEEPSDGTPDALGQVPDVWELVATVWAQIRTPTGRELVNAEQLEGVVSHVITVRRASAWFPKPTGRFVYSSPVYNPTPRVFNFVAAFDPDEGNTWVSCLVTELAQPAESP